jgi:GrpB-like predicted nucleotidyltransferase (UPF0157 family)/RimJ/RimL family protein N-acetyltransferase
MPPDSRIAAAEDLADAGARNAPVEIVEYDPGWPAAFQAERERLAPLLPAGVRLHHFGSTAVPGLAAKPVIDMIALVEDLDAPIAALVGRGGYQCPAAFNATLIHRRFLCYPTAAYRTHHLHLIDEPAELERRLGFRERLRADPLLAKEYVALKRTLARRYRDDREAYTEAKSEFVKRHELPGLELRAAAGADAELLGKAIADGFERYREFAPAGWTPPSPEQQAEQLRTLLDSEDFWCLLAEADSALAGQVAFLPAKQAWRAVEDSRLAHMRQMFLAPHFWGTGLARRLHHRAVHAARKRGFTAMRLFTPAGHTRARRFYQREGWTAAGEPFHQRDEVVAFDGVALDAQTRERVGRGEPLAGCLGGLPRGGEVLVDRIKSPSASPKRSTSPSTT